MVNKIQPTEFKSGAAVMAEASVILSGMKVILLLQIKTCNAI